MPAINRYSAWVVTTAVPSGAVEMLFSIYSPAGIAIELEILASVEDVEAGDPESYGCGEEKDAGVK